MKKQAKLLTQKLVRPTLDDVKLKTNQINNNHRHKLRQAKERLMASSNSDESSNDYRTFLDKQSLHIASKIAFELLDSVKTKSVNGEFIFNSPTAQSLPIDNKELNKKIDNINALDNFGLNEIDKEMEEKTFNILNRSKETVINYKKMLEYLAEKMNFKVNYQSLMGVSNLKFLFPTIFDFKNLIIVYFISERWLCSLLRKFINISRHRKATKWSRFHSHRIVQFSFSLCTRILVIKI
jgi:hypothetical protein